MPLSALVTVWYGASPRGDRARQEAGRHGFGALVRRQIIDLDTGACVIPPPPIGDEDIHTQAPNPEAGHEEEIPPPPPALDEESNVSPR